MSVVKSIRSRISAIYRGAVGPLRDDSNIYRSLRVILGQDAGAVNFPYKQSVWTFSCINAISDNLARVPFRLKSGENRTVEEGALYELFQNPNPYMTQSDLFRASLIFLGLRGEAIWIFEGRDDVTKIPKEIWIFDPARFEPVFEQKQHVGWKYKRGSNEIFFSMWEVLHFRYFNPYDDIRGLPTLEAARASIDQDFFATKYNTSFFKNGARTGGFITVEDELSDEAYTRLVNAFNDRHQGVEKAHKVALIEGGGTFHEAKVSQKDMEFIEGKRMNREEILAAFKVNEVVLGIYKNIKSYEGIKQAHKAFWEECLIPKVTYLEEVLWAKFFSKVGQRRGKGRIWGEFDLATIGALLPNYADKVKMASAMFTMGWPINAINKRLDMGMPDVAWGDMWFVPGGFLPVTALMGASAPKKEEEKKEELGFSIGRPLELERGLSLTPGELTNGYSQCYGIEQKFRSKIKRLFFEQRQMALKAVYSRTEVSFSSKHSNLHETFRDLYLGVLEQGYCAFLNENKQEFTPKELVSLRGGSFGSYATAKTDYMVKNITGLASGLMGMVNEYVQRENPSPEEAAEKVREAFTLLANKCAHASQKDIPVAFAYGRMIGMKARGGDRYQSFVQPFFERFDRPLITNDNGGRDGKDS